MTGEEIQVENGDFARVHNAILEALGRARLTGSEFRCVLYLLRKTYGWGKKEDKISLSQWAEGTGMCRPNIVGILRELERKNVIYRSSDGSQIPIYGFNKYIEQWQEIGVKTGREDRFRKAEALSGEITVITPDNTDQTVITEHTTSVITEHNSTVITEHTHKRQLKTKDIFPHAEKKRADRKQKTELTDREKAEKERQKAIMSKYRETLGYPVPSEPRENKGAQMLAKNGYTADQVIECYLDMKRDKFWADKHISLQSVNGKIGAWHAANNGHNPEPYAVAVY
jgi:phage replication O-like protein O